MISLVSLEQAKVDRRIDDSDHDADVSMKISQASAIAMSFMKRETIPDEWTINTSPVVYDIPFDVQAAVFLMIGELYENREASIANVLSPAVVSLLAHYRMPTMA